MEQRSETFSDKTSLVTTFQQDVVNFLNGFTNHGENPTVTFIYDGDIKEQNGKTQGRVNFLLKDIDPEAISQLKELELRYALVWHIDRIVNTVGIMKNSTEYLGTAIETLSAFRDAVYAHEDLKDAISKITDTKGELINLDKTIESLKEIYAQCKSENKSPKSKIAQDHSAYQLMNALSFDVEQWAPGIIDQKIILAQEDLYAVSQKRNANQTVVSTLPKLLPEGQQSTQGNIILPAFLISNVQEKIRLSKETSSPQYTGTVKLNVVDKAESQEKSKNILTELYQTAGSIYLLPENLQIDSEYNSAGLPISTIKITIPSMDDRKAWNKKVIIILV